MRTITKSIGIGLFLTLMLAATTMPAFAKKKHVIERFRANAVDVDSGRASLVEIGVFEWSTDDERKGLIEAFRSDGNQGAYKLLGKQDEKGFVKLPNTMGYQMRYAYQFESDGKRQIVLATDRPIAMGEVMQDSWTQQDNISFVVLQLDPETGEGSGEMVFGASFKVNEKTGQLEIETVSVQPTKLNKVRAEAVKHKD